MMVSQIMEVADYPQRIRIKLAGNSDEAK